jgi:hypothetical protein
VRPSARLAVGLLTLPLSTLSAQGVYYEGGIGLTSGTYIFTERTNTITLLTGLALQVGPVTIRATLPAYAQNTTLLAGSSTGLIPTGGSSSSVVADSAAARQGGHGGRLIAGRATPSLMFSSTGTEDGADGLVEPPVTAVSGYGLRTGDPNIGLSAALIQGSRIGLLLGFSAKVPLNDTTSFGTGAWDMGASLSLSMSLGLTTMIGITGAYWRMGDPPGLDLRNTAMLSATISHLTISGWGLSASVLSASPVIAGFSSSVSLSAGILRMGARGSVGVNAAVGLTEMAPDFTVGLSWRLGLLRP